MPASSVIRRQLRGLMKKPTLSWRSEPKCHRSRYPMRRQFEPPKIAEPWVPYIPGAESDLLRTRESSVPVFLERVLPAMAVAMVVLKRMLPQSENGVLVVMIVDRF
jgi:hypothetical protein